MADSPEPARNVLPQLASAVVIPEMPTQRASPSPSPAPPPQQPINGHTTTAASLKRRASDLPYDEDTSTPTEDSHAKRARLTNASAQNTQARPARPAADSEADRKRGKRLFGSLLGTLSQPAATGGAQKRRADAERKQRDKLAALSSSSGSTRRLSHAGSRDGEGEEKPGSRRRTAQELEELDRLRRRQQRDWAETEMRVRHASMRARARFLHTRVEPRVHWLPYELTEREEELLDEQKEIVEDAIAGEEEDYRKRHADGDGEEDMELDQTQAVQAVREDSGIQDELSPEQSRLGSAEDADDGVEDKDKRQVAATGVANQDIAKDVTRDANENKDNGEDDEDIPLNRDPEEDHVLY